MRGREGVGREGKERTEWEEEKRREVMEIYDNKKIISAGHERF